MNELLEYTHNIKMSGAKTEDKIIISKIQQEKLALILMSDNRPQFISIDENIINTSFIIGIVKYFRAYNNSKNRELTEEEKQTHKLYLKSTEIKLLKH